MSGLSGSCLCGSVRYHMTAAVTDVLYCHCSQCRKQTGHYLASVELPQSDLVLDQSATLRWFRSSPGAERGFCSDCGSALFWRADAEDTISVTAGSLDGPTGLKTRAHIFTDDAGDYYTIPDAGLAF